MVPFLLIDKLKSYFSYKVLFCHSSNSYHIEDSDYFLIKMFIFINVYGHSFLSIPFFSLNDWRHFLRVYFLMSAVATEQSNFLQVTVNF